MNIFEIIKANPVKDYQKKLAPLLNKNWLNYSYDAIQKSIDLISKGEPFLQAFTDAADKTAMQCQSTLKKQITAIWMQRKTIPTKSQVEKAETTFRFSKPDQIAIESLLTGQLAWIGDYGSNSEIAQEVSAEYGRLWGEGLTRKEIVKELNVKYADLTPAKYAERFGTQKYWDMFTFHHSQLTASFRDIDMLKNRKSYVFYALNNERTCPICGFYHNKKFSTEGSIAIKDAYLSAAKTGNIEAMKEAKPFLTDTTSTNPIPPLHIGCKCRQLSVPGE